MKVDFVTNSDSEWAAIGSELVQLQVQALGSVLVLVLVPVPVPVLEHVPVLELGPESARDSETELGIVPEPVPVLEPEPELVPELELEPVPFVYSFVTFVA